jgi:hypothetical protein
MSRLRIVVTSETLAGVARRGEWLVKDRNVRRLADDNSEETGVAVVSGVLPCLAREGNGC